jgi:hypothetical protein
MQDVEDYKLMARTLSERIIDMSIKVTKTRNLRDLNLVYGDFGGKTYLTYASIA